MAKGDCFKVVFDLVVVPGRVEELLVALGLQPWIGERSALRACHGMPVGQGSYNRGKRHWHAWVELSMNDATRVLDFSNDQRIKIDRDTYYDIGTMTDEHVWRFTPKEARSAARRFGTYGPWING